ncbi:MAG: lytic transglycosylase domain-containing protein [Bacillota bacterium]|nr:lytic transglycosylase domain-containing protein [Bacillota bacterium]
MRKKGKNRFSVFLWLFILLFLAIVLVFPRWITVFYPLSHRDVVFSTASEYEINPYLVFAIIRAESKYETSAESPVGAKGLMQIMPDTAEWIAEQMELDEFNPEDLHDPQVNIRMGCWYVNNLTEEFSGNTALTIAAYNAGRGKVKQWLLEGSWDGNIQTMKGIPFPETRQYVRNVLKNYEAYKAIYE